MKNNLFVIRLVVLIAVISLIASACVPRSVRYGGIVKGVVYADLNGNGTIDAGEGPLEGATVSLSDCGPITSQTTGVDGSFNFTNLPEGTCHVTVAKPGWSFSGSFPSLGYPLPVASNPDLPTAFSISMAPAGGAVAPTITGAAPASTPTFTPTLEPTATDTIGPSETPTNTPETPTATSSVGMVTPGTLDVNCRFGPSTDYLAVGFLRVGQTVPITGTNKDHSWWQIKNLQDPSTFCWLGGANVKTIGDVSNVPIVKIPVGLVIDVSISLTAVIHGVCGGPNAQGFTGHITTNGPTTVTFHWEIYDASNNLLNKTSDATKVFAKATTLSDYPGAYSRDCGSYLVKLVVTSPNSISGQASWQVVSP